MNIRKQMLNWTDAVLQWVPVARLRYDSRMFLRIMRVASWRNGFAVMRKLGDVRDGVCARYGNVLGNLVLAIAGLLNGCRYCGVGHLYAANLYYFQSTGKLLPIDERQTHQLQCMPFEELNDYIRDSLSDSEFAEMSRVMQRVLHLRLGNRPETAEDHEIEHVIDVWNFVNECTIPFGYDAKIEHLGPALSDPVPLDVIRRYQQARERTRK